MVTFHISKMLYKCFILSVTTAGIFYKAKIAIVNLWCEFSIYRRTHFLIPWAYTCRPMSNECTEAIFRVKRSISLDQLTSDDTENLKHGSMPRFPVNTLCW